VGLIYLICIFSVYDCYGTSIICYLLVVGQNVLKFMAVLAVFVFERYFIVSSAGVWVFSLPSHRVKCVTGQSVKF